MVQFTVSESPGSVLVAGWAPPSEDLAHRMWDDEQYWLPRGHLPVLRPILSTSPGLYKSLLVLPWLERRCRFVSESAGVLDRAFHALSDPNRRAILTVVRHGRRAVGDIADVLGLSQQNVSHHLKVLRDAGLVSGSRSGTRHLYAVHVEGLAVGKAFFDDFWPERLSALKRAVEGSSGAGNDG